MTEMTSEQRSRFKLLSRALQRAVDNVMNLPQKETPEEDKDKKRASRTLLQARLRFVGSKQDREDLKTGTLMIYLDKKSYAEIKALLVQNPQLETMHKFGGLPWEAIQAVFDAAGVACPLEFQIFHTAYQEELKNFSGKPPESPDPIGFAYMG